MRNGILETKSKAFAIKVMRTCKTLRMAGCEPSLIRQFFRSGTSIGANLCESVYAQSIQDFVSKMQISLKECAETEFWIELMMEEGYVDDTSLFEDCIEIKKLLIASINTAKRRVDAEKQGKKGEKPAS